MSRPIPSEVMRGFKEGFDNEPYLVDAIREYLLTATQRNKLFDINKSIEDCLNGRFGSDEEPVVLAIFAEWNAIIGFHGFGY